MTIILSSPAATRPLAENYDPNALPPACVLCDWLRAAGYTMSMETLVSNLKSGKPFAFGSGTVTWSET